jgi:hypothetical protein
MAAMSPLEIVIPRCYDEAMTMPKDDTELPAARPGTRVRSNTFGGVPGRSVCPLQCKLLLMSGWLLYTARSEVEHISEHAY